MLKRLAIFLTGLIIGFSPLYPSKRDTLSLEGIWEYNLLGAPSSIPGEGEIFLPSTLDSSHKSVYNPLTDETAQLRREFSFIGNAIYSKFIEIPTGWENKNIFLNMERTKPTTLIIDGDTIGSNSVISSSQKYDLTGILTPGLHHIKIAVNNADSIPPVIARSSNAVAESSQTNWNGILGAFFLEARNPFNISAIIIDDRLAPDSVKISVKFSQPIEKKYNIGINLNGQEIIGGKTVIGSDKEEFIIGILPGQLWSAEYPVLHDLEIIVTDDSGNLIDTYATRTGFRKFSSSDGLFTVNDRPVFLRGTVNAAVFPLTGYAPVDKESWIRYFSILKDYGLNHVRFHSWTPPEAAFTAADELGIYIMTELPMWGELDRDMKFHNRFLIKDLSGMMNELSHHPSLVMFSPGNELWGDISLMSEYMNMAKELNPRILATQGTNLYLGMNGYIGGEDFIVAAKLGEDSENAIRGSMSFADSSSGGYLNSHYPNSAFDFQKIVNRYNIPIISHEVGQYQSYPDFEEIAKYKGDLKPDNLLEFMKRADEAGTLNKNREFSEASGKWTARLLKAEMEAAQRTPGLAGYQLFGLQDYPGQGTANVGILDPFMDSKGYITPEEWKESSSDILILAKFPKFSFTESERVRIPLSLVNFSSVRDSKTKIYWNTDFDKGSIHFSPSYGLTDIGTIEFSIPEVSKPEIVTLSLSSDNKEVNNSYKFYVYPKHREKINKVYVTDNVDEALKQLEKGDRVFLCPDSTLISSTSLEPLFVNDFWNYRMYRSICDEMGLPPSPGTLGLYMQATHPVFNKFPTEGHTDWQWYPIIVNSRPLIIDRLPKDFNPLIEVIDNVERNFRLALLLECKVGKGKLMILPGNLAKLEQYPEGRWFIQSIKEYMAGKEFNPPVTLTPSQVINLLTKPSVSRKVKELKNETYRKF